MNGGFPAAILGRFAKVRDQTKLSSRHSVWPKMSPGIRILHPWYHQERVHLLVCLKQTAIGGITGRQISSSTEQMRLKAGLPG
jgi:hypothetical protein